MTLALKDLLSDSTEFRTILGKAHALHALQQQLIPLLPPNLAPYFQVLGMEFGTLTIAASNATVAAKIRQNTPELIDKFNKMGAEVNGIRVKVQVSYPLPASKNKARQLSHTAKEDIKQLEASLPDSPLKDALHRMSSGNNTGRKS